MKCEVVHFVSRITVKIVDAVHLTRDYFLIVTSIEAMSTPSCHSP